MLMFSLNIERNGGGKNPFLCTSAGATNVKMNTKEKLQECKGGMEAIIIFLVIFFFFLMRSSKVSDVVSWAAYSDEAESHDEAK